jgi:fructose-1,6-bisphosphatase/inositol monophosphatase family enzyme
MWESRLKICDLCGAPNLMENAECNVCGWRGHFSAEPAKVRSVIEATRRLQRHETARPDHLIARLPASMKEVWQRLQSWYRRRGSAQYPFYF